MSAHRPFAAVVALVPGRADQPTSAEWLKLGMTTEALNFACAILARHGLCVGTFAAAPTTAIVQLITSAGSA
jgi:hypothetical protein